MADTQVTPAVLVDVEEGVGHIRLNRPDASNAMSLELLRALHQAVLDCDSNRDVRVILLSGEGRNFCGGGDVREFASHGADLPWPMRDITAHLQAAAAALIHSHAVVVTAVQGWATGGGGVGLVCASDIVFAAQSARFMLAASRVGMIPDAGATVMLPHLIGFRRAMEFALTEQVLSASEALDLGLITEVVPDEDLAPEARALAVKLAGSAPLALGATKRLLWQGVGNAVEARLGEEARTQTELSGTADAREGLAAVIEKRDPNFTGT
jgi:2-(1,2-epoxy-1,2-dihydrophenyl)acetyl-CoA isomerase